MNELIQLLASQDSISLFAGLLIIGFFITGYPGYRDDCASDSDFGNLRHEGGEEEEEEEEEEEDTGDVGGGPTSYFFRIWRWLLRMAGPYVAMLRYWIGDWVIYSLDPENFNFNKEELAQTTTYYDWFNGILNLVIRKFVQHLQIFLNHPFATMGLYCLWRGYLQRRSLVNTNPFLMNSIYYRHYLRLYESIAQRLANSAGLPIASVDYILFAWRACLNILRNFIRRR